VVVTGKMASDFGNLNADEVGIVEEPFRRGRERVVEPRRLDQLLTRSVERHPVAAQSRKKSLLVHNRRAAAEGALAGEIVGRPGRRQGSSLDVRRLANIPGNDENSRLPTAAKCLNDGLNLRRLGLRYEKNFVLKAQPGVILANRMTRVFETPIRAE